ncbi:MAG TPA: hypothetical protein VGO52_21555 [Hyphomonadaceae bacterium]|jgi:hypothetical protein|nr:hypothetical protein [Hyphomonadaceae bacterium]
MSRPPLASQNADHLPSLNTEPPRATDGLSRRTFLVGTMVAALATSTASADAPRATEPDAQLIDLERTFQQALDTYEAARQRFNRCEEQYFDLCPCLPEALTSDGPLGHLLSWSHWSAADLRRMLKNHKHRDVWDEVHKALAIAKAYEAGRRRAKRKTNLRAVEAAHNAAIDAIGDVGGLILAAPAQSLESLAVKARVIKTWGRREWWDREDGDADTYERLAAQIIDAVVAATEAQRKGGAG